MKNLTTPFATLLAATTFLLFTLSCNSEKEPIADEPPMEVTAVKLLADYEANVKTAHDQYGEKTLIVSGKILGITTNQDGTSFVLINSPESSIGSVRCMFTADQQAATAGLVREQQTAIKGVCKGMDVVQVVLTGCSLHDAAAAAAAGKPKDHPNNQKALDQISDDERIMSSFISDGNILYASVVNDGTKKDRLAQQLCGILSKNNATTKWVKVIEADTFNTANPDNPFGILLAEAHCE